MKERREHQKKKKPKKNHTTEAKMRDRKKTCNKTVLNGGPGADSCKQREGLPNNSTCFA